MSNATQPQTQAQKPLAQSIPSSDQSKTAQPGTTPKKDEKTVQSGKENMANEGGGSCSTTGNKPKSSNY